MTTAALDPDSELYRNYMKLREQGRRDFAEIKRMVLGYGRNEVIEMAREADMELADENTDTDDYAYNDPRTGLARWLNRKGGFE